MNGDITAIFIFVVIPKICGVKLFLSEQFSSEDQVPAAFKDESRLVAETHSNDGKNQRLSMVDVHSSWFYRAFE